MTRSDETRLIPPSRTVTIALTARLAMIHPLILCTLILHLVVIKVILPSSVAR